MGLQVQRRREADINSLTKELGATKEALDQAKDELSRTTATLRVGLAGLAWGQSWSAAQPMCKPEFKALSKILKKHACQQEAMLTAGLPAE